MYIEYVDVYIILLYLLLAVLLGIFKEKKHDIDAGLVGYFILVVRLLWKVLRNLHWVMETIIACRRILLGV